MVSSPASPTTFASLGATQTSFSWASASAMQLQQRRLESSAPSTSSPSSPSPPSPLASLLSRAKSKSKTLLSPSPSFSSSLLSPSSLSSSSSSPEGFASRQRVLRLPAEAAWSRWGRLLVFLAGGAGAFALYKGTRSIVVEKSRDGSSLSREAKAAAASAAAVAAVAFAYRQRVSAPPRLVHAAAMRRLCASPAVVEVLGAPVVSPSASAPRAAVESGGGLRFRSVSASSGSSSLPSLVPRPAWRPRRVQAVFAVEGSQRRALASVDARKEGGELKFRVLSLDVPVVVGGGEESTASELSHRRIFLEGDESGYARGGVLPALRSALVNASASRGAFDAADDVDAAAEEAAAAAALRAQDAARLAEAERRLRRAVVVEGEGGQGPAAAASDAVPVVAPVPWWRRVFTGRPPIV